jgi:hypothetical protein
MSLTIFSEDWIKENVPTSDIYGDAIQKNVAELVDTFVLQRNSGVSVALTLHYFTELMKDYRNG